MTFNFGNIPLLFGFLILLGLAFYIGACIPTEKEKSAYAGGLSFGCLLMLIFAAWVSSQTH